MSKRQSARYMYPSCFSFNLSPGDFADVCLGYWKEAVLEVYDGVPMPFGRWCSQDIGKVRDVRP